jgi:hypothetical protein
LEFAFAASACDSEMKDDPLLKSVEQVANDEWAAHDQQAGNCKRWAVMTRVTARCILTKARIFWLVRQ